MLTFFGKNTPGGTPTSSTNPHLPQEGVTGYGGHQTSKLHRTPGNERAGSSESQDIRKAFTVATLAVEGNNATSEVELERSYKALYQLRADLEDLTAFTYAKKNVSKDIIAKMHKLEMTYEKAELAIAQTKESRRESVAVSGKDAQNQWSPKRGQLYLKDVKSPTSPLKNVKKRMADGSPSTSPEGWRGTKKARRLRRKLERDLVGTTKATEKETVPKSVKQAKNRPPKTAVKMKRTPTVRRKFTRPTRLDTLVVKAKGENSYADILKSLRGDADLRNLGDSVTKIQKNAAGNLVLVLNRGAHDEMSKLRSIVEKKLVDKAEVTGQIDKMFIELRDLDELTTAEEICEAIKSQITKATDVDAGVVKSLRKAYRGRRRRYWHYPPTWQRRSC